MNMEAGLIQGLQTNKYPQGSKIPPEAKAQLEDKKLKDKCNEFQSILYSCMLKSMRSTVQKSGLIDGGNAEDIYTSMLDEEYAKIMSKNTKSSIADALYNQLRHDKTGMHTINNNAAQGGAAAGTRKP